MGHLGWNTFTLTCIHSLLIDCATGSCFPESSGKKLNKISWKANYHLKPKQVLQMVPALAWNQSCCKVSGSSIVDIGFAPLLTAISTPPSPPPPGDGHGPWRQGETRTFSLSNGSPLTKPSTLVVLKREWCGSPPSLTAFNESSHSESSGGRQGDGAARGGFRQRNNATSPCISD